MSVEFIWSDVFGCVVAAAARADIHSLKIYECSKGSVLETKSALIVEPWMEISPFLADHKLRLWVIRNGNADRQGCYLLILGQS